MDRKRRLDDVPLLGTLQTLLSMLTMTILISLLNVAESAELRIPDPQQRSNDPRGVSALVKDSTGTDPASERKSSNLQQPLFLEVPRDLKDTKVTTKTYIDAIVKASNERSHSIENINDARLSNVSIVHSLITADNRKLTGQENDSRKETKRDISRDQMKRNKWSNEITKNEIKRNLHATSNLLVDVSLQTEDNRHDNRAKLRTTRRNDRSVDSAIFHSENRTGSVTEENPENATFHPDKVLFDVNRIMTKGSAMQSTANKTRYITQEKAEMLRKKKRQPVQPLPVHPDELPIVPIDYERVPHETGHRDSQDSINLVSRKLFVRPNTSKRRSRYEKRSSNSDNGIAGVFESDARALSDKSILRLTDAIPVDVSMSQVEGKKTVKKDLSRKSISDFSSLEKHRANDRKERSTIEIRSNDKVENVESVKDSLLAKEQASKRTFETSSDVTNTRSIEKRWRRSDNTSYEFYKRRLKSDYPRIDVYDDIFYPELPRIEDTYVEAFRKKRDVSNVAAERAKIEMRPAILGDRREFSAKPYEVRRKIYPIPKNRRSTYEDLSHVRWEGHYIAGKK